MPRNDDAPMTLGEFARLARSVDTFHHCLDAVPTGGKGEGLSRAAWDALVRRRKRVKNITRALRDLKYALAQELVTLNLSDGRTAPSQSELTEILWPERLKPANA